MCPGVCAGALNTDTINKTNSSRAKHREPAVSDGVKRKSTEILDDNSCRDGVENIDKVVGTFSSERKTNRWLLALFYNPVDVSPSGVL